MQVFTKPFNKRWFLNDYGWTGGEQANVRLGASSVVISAQQTTPESRLMFFHSPSASIL